jgi:glycosyltransferase involved in cell wall biosynthesis
MSDFLSIVIPAYNEEDNIEAVVRESLEVLQNLSDRFEIVVVDDASTDATWYKLQELAKQIAQLRIIRNEKNLGCHPASLVGYQAAQGDYRYFIPADRQIPAAEITKFLEKAKAGFDVVYSWRQKRADPFHRIWISNVYNLILNLFFGIKVHDVDSSEMLTRTAVERILPNIHADNVLITTEILLEARRQGLSIAEVVIEHRPRTAGKALSGLNAEILRLPGNFFRILFWFWGQKLKGRMTHG